MIAVIQPAGKELDHIISQIFILSTISEEVLPGHSNSGMLPQWD